MIYTKRLLIAIVFLVTVVQCSTRKSNRIDYRFNNNDFEVRCWGLTGSLVMKVVCHGNAWANFPNVKFDPAVVGKVEFDNCSFPESFSLHDQFHAFNTSSYKTIRIVNARSSPHRRNFQGLKISRLEFMKSSLKELDADMLYNVTGVREVLIERNNLERVPEGFFKDWAKNVQKVDLDKNQLRKIHKNDFTRLTGVKTIDLSNNKISEIEAGAFDDLVNLKVLNLNNNRLRILPAGIFHDLSRLKKLYLNRNHIDELPQDLLSGILDSHLDGFYMCNNTGSLRTLPGRFFKNLNYLAVIGIENNSLESLPADLLSGTSELSMLMLGNNQLSRLPFGLFNDTQKLLDLDLSNNRLENLPDKIFENLYYLEYLGIDHNYLTILNSEMLTGLSHLKELNASNNNLTRIDEQLFAFLESAIVIDLSYNRITFDVQDTHFSTYVNVPESMSSNLDSNQVRYDDMKSIDLRYNNITEITVEHIKKLKYGASVDLRHNRISKINLAGIPFQMFMGNEFNSTFKNMKLLLSNNPLNCECQFIDLVHYLDLEGGNDDRKFIKFVLDNESGGSLVCTSPSELKKLYGVNSIYKKNNCLLKMNVLNDACVDTCTCKEHPAKQVLHVDCSHRNLNKIPAFIRNTHNWSIELDMSHNALTETPSLDESYLVNVRSLDLSYNNINSVMLSVFSSSLKELKLHHNSISRLDSQVIQHLAHKNPLRSVTLHENKWMCDCRARNFLSFVQKKLTTYNLHKVTCHGTNQKLHEMTVNDMCDNINDTVICVSILITFFGFVFGSLAALYYGHQKQIKLCLYSKKWRFWLFKRDKLDRNKKYDAFVSLSQRDNNFVEHEITAKLKEGLRPY